MVCTKASGIVSVSVVLAGGGSPNFVAQSPVSHRICVLSADDNALSTKESVDERPFGLSGNSTIVADARDEYLHQFCVVWERGCTAFSTASPMMVVLTTFPLTRGSVDYDDIIGREIGCQGTGGVHDHNTRPMSPTSVASEHYRYFTGIASISINRPSGPREDAAKRSPGTPGRCSKAESGEPEVPPFPYTGFGPKWANSILQETT
eukprot:scaffold22704_cov199-Skeletonema_marinoi.AAC.1